MRVYLLLAAKLARACQVLGMRYKDGEHFKMNCTQKCCSQQCTCQNGVVTCTSLCPHEDHAPSRLHCPNAVLVHTVGSKGTSCCREWVCPHAHREGLDDQPVHNLHPAPSRSRTAKVDSKRDDQVVGSTKHGRVHGHHHHRQSASSSSSASLHAPSPDLPRTSLYQHDGT
jgi:hypothetical protein